MSGSKVSSSSLQLENGKMQAVRNNIDNIFFNIRLYIKRYYL